MVASRVKYHLVHTPLAFVLRRPRLSLFVIAILTAAMIFPLPRLAFQTSIYDLIIEDLPSVTRYESFLDRFGSDEIIRVAVTAPDVFAPETWSRIQRLSEDLAAVDGVRRMLSLPAIKRTMDTTGDWTLAAFRELVAPVELFNRNLISKDHRTTILTLVVAGDADRAAVVAEVAERLQTLESPMRGYQIGMPLVSEALAEYSRKDFWRLTPIALAVITVVLCLFYGLSRYAWLPLSTVVLALIWLLGAMAWFGIPVSMLSIIIPVFLIAVGTAYCLHICTAYRHAVEAGLHGSAAIEVTFADQVFPVVLAAITTVFGIGSLLANRIAAIQEFALLACFGIAGLLVLLLVYFPAVLAVLPPAGEVRRGFGWADRGVGRLVELAIQLSSAHSKQVILIMTLVALVVGGGLFRIRVETDPVSFFKASTPVRRHFHAIYADMSGSIPVNVAINGPVDDFFESIDTLKNLLRLQEALTELPGVDKAISVADYLMLVNFAVHRYDASYYRLPDDPHELRMLLNRFKILLGSDLLRRFLTSDYRHANVHLLTHIASSKGILEARNRIDERVASVFEDEATWDVTGLSMVVSDSSHWITLGQIKSLAISIGLIFFLMSLLFLSVRVGMIAIVPNLFPILINFGIMGWFGIHLSVATVLIASVVIGLAVDDTLHFLVRYNTEFKKDLDKDRALGDALAHVGRPIVLTTIAIGLGFAVLMASSFQPTAVFGLMMVVTMIAALAADLILLPALMRHVELVTAWDMLRLMPTVGALTPGMAHELNQPLNAIKVGSEFLKLLVAQGAGVQEKHLVTVSREISAQVDRAAGIIQRLQDIGPDAEPKKIHLDINQPVRGTLDLLGHQLHLNNIDVSMELAPSLPLVIGHYNRLVQVVFNLVTNASEAIADRPLPEVGAHGSIRLATWGDGNRVVLDIHDTGVGMDDSVRERAFEPFFSTRARGKGRGLGLAICRQIIKDNGGRIRLTSETGKGTTVSISFPVAPVSRDGSSRAPR